MEWPLARLGAIMASATGTSRWAFSSAKLMRPKRPREAPRKPQKAPKRLPRGHQYVPEIPPNCHPEDPESAPKIPPRDSLKTLTHVSVVVATAAVIVVVPL